MDNNGKIKILLTDDHKVMRDGLKVLFNSHPNMTIVGEADNLKAAEQIVQRVRPDIITIGMNIDGDNYIDAVKALVKEFPDIRIVAHSAYNEKEFVSQILKAGTIAYVHKEDTFTELVKAVDAAIHGHLYLCPRIANIVMSKNR